MRARTRRLRSFCFGIGKSPSFSPRARPPAAKPSNEGFRLIPTRECAPLCLRPFDEGGLRWGKTEEVRRESAPRGIVAFFALVAERDHAARIGVRADQLQLAFI